MDNGNNILDISGLRSSKEAMLEAKKRCIRKRREDGKCLTLEETAFAIWDPKHEKKPMTPMGILKFERRTLDKFKRELEKRGIRSLDDVFDPKHREIARQDTTREY